MTALDISVAQAALRVNSADDVEWDKEVDVIVVGFGGAGACAALQAHEGGAQVLVVDRFEGGGSTAYSGGILYAGGTAVQRAAGVDDDSEEMLKYLTVELSAAVKPETLRAFCAGSAADVDWLLAHGMQYQGDVCVTKTFYPPETSSLYFSGNEKQLKQKSGAKPAPRGHRALGKGYTGYAFFATLQRAVFDAGIDVIKHTLATRLIVDCSGHVIGIEAQPIADSAMARHQSFYAAVTPLKPLNPTGQEKLIADCRRLEAEQTVPPIHIRGRHGVILAAGGYVFNLGMLNKMQPFLAAHYKSIIRLGCIGDDGSGIHLGQSVGGDVKMLENVFLNRSISPPDSLLKGVAVNTKGERFINEDTYTGDFGAAIAAQPDGKAWLVLDRRHFVAALTRCLTAGRSQFKAIYAPTLLNLLFGGTRISFTVRGLERRLRLPDGSLIAVANENNAAAAAGNDRLGKLPEHLKPIRGAPYFAVTLSISNRLSFSKMFTLSGLAVDEATGAVRRANGSNIEGLYAAGRNAAGLCAIGYISGMSIADCVFSGRRAGRHVAELASTRNLESTP